MTLKPELICLNECCVEFPNSKFASHIQSKSVSYHLLDKERNIVVKFSTQETRLCSKIAIDNLSDIPHAVITMRAISFLHYCCEDINLLPKWDKGNTSADDMAPDMLPMYIKVSCVPSEKRIDIALPITDESEELPCVQISIDGGNIKVGGSENDRILQNVYTHVPSIISLLQLLKKRCDRSSFSKMMAADESSCRGQPMQSECPKVSKLNDMFNSVIERFTAHTTIDNSPPDCKLEENDDTINQDEVSEDEPMDMSMPRTFLKQETTMDSEMSGYLPEQSQCQNFTVPSEKQVTKVEFGVPSYRIQSSKDVKFAFDMQSNAPQIRNWPLTETFQFEENSLMQKQEMTPQLTNSIIEPTIVEPILAAENAETKPKRKGRRPKSETLRQVATKGRESSQAVIGQLRSEKVDLLRLKITTCKDTTTPTISIVDPITAEPTKERKKPGRKRGSTTTQIARQQSSTIKCKPPSNTVDNPTKSSGLGALSLFSDQFKDSSLSTFKIPRKKPPNAQKPSVGLLPIPTMPSRLVAPGGSHSEGLTPPTLYPQQSGNGFRRMGKSSSISPQIPPIGFTTGMQSMMMNTPDHPLRYPPFPTMSASTPVRRPSRPRHFQPSDPRFRFG